MEAPLSSPFFPPLFPFLTLSLCLTPSRVSLWQPYGAQYAAVSFCCLTYATKALSTSSQDSVLSRGAVTALLLQASTTQAQHRHFQYPLPLSQIV